MSLRLTRLSRKDFLEAGGRSCCLLLENIPTRVEFLNEEGSEIITFLKCPFRQQLNRATLNLNLTPNTYIPKLNIALPVTKDLISLAMSGISLGFLLFIP